MEKAMWRETYSVTNINDSVRIMSEQAGQARIIAGATDLILEIERGVRKGIHTLVDISRVPGLDQILLDEQEWIHLGPLVTHNHCVASKLVRERAYPLARAAWEVGAPQIRNRGTVAGNLITASPANDTITPLMALGAQVTLRSIGGERTVALQDFYTGVRRTVMQPDEVLVDIAFPAMSAHQRGTFIKLGLRRAQAISVVDVAIILTFDDMVVKSAAITLGAVAPTIIHAVEAEKFLAGKVLSENIVARAAELAMEAARPIDDLRGSAAYRREMIRVCVKRGLLALQNGAERADFPEQPVLLWGAEFTGQVIGLSQPVHHANGDPIITRINGKEYRLPGGQEKTLLRLIREDAGLIGTKEGCAEGECGACTVFLDGIAIMSCMAPAARAHGAEIVTIEGLAHNGQLHPIQQAFIDESAVQCGYCTPGFLMSGAKLLEERPTPSKSEIKQAITGNLCRCTGYYSIVNAIEKAAKMATQPSAGL
jgi:carbon-monoxide dehydrogenase medium subunit